MPTTRLWIGALAAILLSLALLPRGETRDASALWDVVHGLCVPDKRVTHLPFPCAAVDRAGGFAVVKDFGRSGYLLVPTRRLTGIEDPRLLMTRTPNYWAMAWASRSYVLRRIGRPLPPEDIGLAVNARDGRSQDQLHIHVDCVREDVREALAAARFVPGDHWSVLSLHGHFYAARALSAAQLTERDPFRLLADDGPSGATALADQTMALIGSRQPDGQPGFVLLAAPSVVNHGHAEELLDHACRLAAAR